MLSRSAIDDDKSVLDFDESSCCAHETVVPSLHSQYPGSVFSYAYTTARER